MSALDYLDIEHQQLIELYRRALASGESLADLERKVAKKIKRLMISQQKEDEQDEVYTHKLKHALPRIVRFGANLLPVSLIVIGFLLLGSAVVPILGSYLTTFPQSHARQLIAPIPQEKVIDVTPLVVAQAQDSQESLGQKLDLRSGPIVVDAELDYTNLSTWFEDEALTDLRNRTSKLSEQTGEYILEIPELEIYQAVVKIGGTDLEESIIQYPGTSLPGKPGSPVVFGHSVLRQFYNPKQSNPRRYNSIFSYIMTLDKGDKIYIRYGDVKYTYMVQGKKEVKPTDTYILAQDYSQRQFKMVTCVPEGTYLKRGVVVAQLVRD